MIAPRTRQPLTPMHPRISSQLLRSSALAVVTCVLLLAAGVVTAQAAEAPWGQMARHEFGIGSGEGQVDGLKTLETTFAAAPEGNYFVAEKTKAGQFRIQQFVAGSLKGAVSFSGTQSVKEPEATEIREAFGPLSLTVDPAHKRVYALETFLRREQDAKELLEEEGSFPHFPLDEAQPAAGALYAFEYTGTELNAVNGGAPLLTAEQLKQQGEKPEEALLNPRGMAVDPRTGTVAIAATLDIQENSKVEHFTGEKQCRPVAQYIVPGESGGKLTGSAAIGHRLMDKGALMANEEHGEDPCGEAEETGAYERTPLSPVITNTGRLLVYFDDEAGAEALPQIWELASPTGAPLTTAETAAAGTTTAKPRKLWDEERYEFSGEELASGRASVGVSEMSLLTEGGISNLYVNVIDSYETAWSGAPNLLRLTEPAKSTEAATLSEVGVTAGASVPTGGIESAPACGIVDPAEPSAQIAALAGNKYLAFSQFKQLPGSAEHAEVKEFGEGGSTAGCPAEPTLTPEIETPEEPVNASHVPLGLPVTVRAAIGIRLENGSVKYAGFARSIEWQITYRSPTGAETTEPPIKESFSGEPVAGEVEMKHAFTKVGTYKIRAVITTTNLGHPAAAIAPADEVTASAKALTTLQELLPEPKEVPAHEKEVTLKAQVEPPAPGEALHLTRAEWSFGDGSAPVEEKLEGEPPVEGVHLLKAQKHSFSRCGAGASTTCKVKVVVEGFTEKSGVKTFYEGAAEKPVTVTESAKEREEREEKEKKEQKEREEKEKIEREAREKAEREQAAREAAEREAREAAERAAREAAERAAREQAEREGHHGVAGFTATVAGGTFTIPANGALSLKVSCPSGSNCAGTLGLTATIATTSKKHGKTVHKKATLTIGGGSFSVAGGQTQTVSLHLSSKALAALNTLHRLVAQLTVTSRSQTAQNVAHVSLTLKPAPKKKH